MEIFLKRCCKCKIEKTLNCFTKDKSRKDNLYPKCKDCQKAYWHSSEIVKNKKEERRKQREAIKLENKQKDYTNITSKICRECKEEKSVEFFGRLKSTKDGYRNICKKCKRKYDIIYKQTPEYMEQARKSQRRRREDPERKQREKEYNQRPEVVAKRREQSRLFNQTPEGRERKKRLNQLPSIKACKKRYKQSDAGKAAERRYREKNSDKVAMRVHKRRALEYNAPGEWTSKDVKQMLLIQERKCWFCKSVFVSTKLCKKGYHVEHRIPLSRGGTNFPSNLCLSCPGCNLKKYMKTEEEFQEILRKEKELKNIETKIEEKVDKFVSKILFKKSY